MNTMVEGLESRRLMSATVSATVQADLQKLTDDSAAAQAQVAQYMPTMLANAATLRADLLASHSPVNRLLLGREQGAGMRFLALTRAGTNTFLRVELATARRVIADGLRLAAHPGNAVLQARVTLDQATFNTAATVYMNRLGAIQSVVGALAAAAYNTILSVNPTNSAISADIQTSQSDGSAFLAALGTSLGTTQTDLATLVNDVATGA
ncbi:MAG TPA: hypothetical protein VLJ39_18410 [Tepidisphaeraceae bacterium]|nr:hypothetical protein [Tepidisphaeraceae bacterium]